ncbi:MAG: cysteine desulfurase [Lachnospiraceae bacterium]|nr:cysteine desulfurase [Lachnospiraceae bacterium]
MEVYLDNSATTKVMDEAAHLVVEIFTKDYGNASSMHKKGVSAERYIKYAKETLAKIMKVKDKEIYFTSGGTESDNWALIGSAYANMRAGRHLITTQIEHPAILQTMDYLERQGFEVTYLPVSKEGIVSLDALRKALRPDTILVSIMQVNNEVGAMQPIEEAAAIIKKQNPQTLFHVDAVQGFGKLPMYPKKWGVDMVSVSGHKIHAPKGIGILYVREGVKIRPLIYGGGQQKNYRSGTENVPGAAGIAKAAELLYKHLDRDTERLYELRRYFIGELLQMDDVYINGPLEEGAAPHIVSASIKGIRSEVLLHALEERDIFVSAGSACASKKHTVSATLQAMQIEQALLDSTIRFSFSIYTTKEELDDTLKALREIIPMLRRYKRH